MACHEQAALPPPGLDLWAGGGGLFPRFRERRWYVALRVQDTPDVDMRFMLDVEDQIGEAIQLAAAQSLDVEEIAIAFRAVRRLLSDEPIGLSQGVYEA